jgi:hypothetical protein
MAHVLLKRNSQFLVNNYQIKGIANSTILLDKRILGNHEPRENRAGDIDDPYRLRYDRSSENPLRCANVAYLSRPLGKSFSLLTAMEPLPLENQQERSLPFW